MVKRSECGKLLPQAKRRITGAQKATLLPRGAARAGGTEISREEKAQFYGKPLPLMLYFKMSYKRCTSEMRQCLPQNAALQRCGPENSFEAIR